MAEKKGHSLVRTIYLYIFALLGLSLIITGAVRLVDMGLKTFVFTKADEERRLAVQQPPLAYSIERVEELKGEESLSEEQKAAIDQWLADYRQWQERSSKIDYIEIQRQRDVSSSLSTMLVGLPLYLYHWGIIKREVRRQEKSK
jgi:hypothetical protein